MTSKRVGVVILNWNGRALLEQFLPSVCAHTPTEIADVLVADNGSTDDSLAFLQVHYPEVGVIAMPTNTGFAQGYNIALRELAYEYVVLLNSDVMVSRHWLEPLVAYADAHPEVAAIQPKIRSLRQDGFFEHAGAAGGFIDSLGYAFCRGRIFATVERDQGQYDCVLPIFWASGACFFTRLSDYKAAGGLDEHFFAHMEEIDLCWRYHRMGKEVVCVPESVVKHLGGATLDVENPRKTYLNFRNNLLMLYKNLPVRGRSTILFIRQLLDGVAALQFLLTGKWQNVGAIYRAHRDMRKMTLSIYRLMDDGLPRQKEYEKQVCRVRSIVWKYYLGGKKHFDSL